MAKFKLYVKHYSQSYFLWQVVPLAGHSQNKRTPSYAPPHKRRLLT